MFSFYWKYFMPPILSLHCQQSPMFFGAHYSLLSLTSSMNPLISSLGKQLSIEILRFWVRLEVVRWPQVNAAELDFVWPFPAGPNRLWDSPEWQLWRRGLNVKVWISPVSGWWWLNSVPSQDDRKEAGISLPAKLRVPETSILSHPA